jgi:urease accessory protein UreH
MTGGEANSFAGSPPGVNQRAGTSGDTSAGPDLSPWSEGAAGRTGRDGLLRLGFQRNGRRTVLTERRFRLPLQVLEPLDLDPSGAAVVVMLNPTGGILGGDRLETTVTLGDGSHACLTTPAAARAYRSAGPVAVQTFTASVGEGAVLEYVPDHLIPSPGARLHQRTAIALGPRATLIVVDAWAVGRIARSEAWSFGELDLELVVRDAGGLLLRDRAVLRGIEDAHGDRGRWQGGLGGSEGFGYVANFAARARCVLASRPCRRVACGPASACSRAAECWRVCSRPLPQPSRSPSGCSGPTAGRTSSAYLRCHSGSSESAVPPVARPSDDARLAIDPDRDPIPSIAGERRGARRPEAAVSAFGCAGTPHRGASGRPGLR